MQDSGKVLGEVEIDTAPGGGSWNLCNYGRQKALCCQISKAIPKPLYCDKTTCDFYPETCDQDNFDALGNPYPISTGGDGKWNKARSILSTSHLGSDDIDADAILLDRRGPKREFVWLLPGKIKVRQSSRPYPTPQQYMTNLRHNPTGVSNYGWSMRSRECGSPRLDRVQLDPRGPPPARGQVEHTIPVSTTQRTAVLSLQLAQIRFFH